MPLHNEGKKDALTAFIQATIGEPERVQHPSVERDAEVQEALKAQAALAELRAAIAAYEDE